VPDRVLRSASCLVFAALLGKTGAAQAAVDAADRLFGGTSSCPSPAAVRGEVETLVPRERLNTRLRAASLAGAAPVEVVDLGVRFQIVAAGNTREYRDEARDCAHRARIAAVFVVLVIDPAAILTETAAAPPVPAPPPTVAAPSEMVAAVPAALAPGARAARVHVGLGAATAVDALEVRWANGSTVRYPPPRVDTAITIDQAATPVLNE